MRPSLLCMLLMLCVALLGTGCDGGGSGDCDCDDQIERMIEASGPPEEIERMERDDFASATYWYWCLGFARTFNWGDQFDVCCAQSTLTFTPICEE